jgi:hypothetical protein
MCENKSLIGFSLNTALYFFNCLVSFSSFLKLLISAMRGPLGLDMDRFDLADLLFTHLFSKSLFKIRYLSLLHVFYAISILNLYDFLSE